MNEIIESIINDEKLESVPKKYKAPPVPTTPSFIPQKELEGSIPMPPPLPDNDTFKLIKSRQPVVLTEESFVDNNNNHSIKSKPKEVLNSPIDSVAHNALLDAIKRRKQLVDDVGAESLSASIENKVNQSKKLNSSRKSNNKTIPKRESLMPSNTSTTQNYGLLASGTNSVIVKNSSNFNSAGNNNENTSVNFDSERQTYHAKTLPKNVKKLSEESNGAGFLADAEKLRLLFLQKKFNSTRNLVTNTNDDSTAKAQTGKEALTDNTFKDSTDNTNTNLIDKTNKDSTDNTIEDSTYNTNENSKDNKVTSEPPLSQKQSENIIVSKTSNSPPITLPKPDADNTTQSKKINNQPQKNDLHSKLFEEIKNTKNSEKNTLKPPMPQLKLETNINNQNQAPTPPPTASPSIAALATIVAERAQKKRDTIQKVQEPFSGQSKTYFSGNTLNKNIGSPGVDNSKSPLQKPMNLSSTSSTNIETKAILPTSPPNKKFYSSSKAPVSPLSGIAREKPLETKTLFTRSSDNQLIFPKNDKTNSIKSTTPSNNITNLTKNFQTNALKPVPTSLPKPLIKSANINKFNEYKPSQENNKVSNLTLNFSNDSKPQKKIIKSFIKNNSEPAEPPKQQDNPINGNSKTLNSSYSDDTYPTLRKTPQTTNTLIFKAKPSSTPSSPLIRKL